MIRTLRLGLLVSLATIAGLRGEAMLQGFNASWSEITAKMPEIAEAGYESLWLPPPAKAGGGYSVGYDIFDRFDLGSKDQKGTVGTRYGTEAELIELVRTAHRFGIRVYFDNIMNHNGFDIPGYNEFVPYDHYPGFTVTDFHVRDQGDGTYRGWDNTRDWGSEWQVQNLYLSGLIDIATEPGTLNFNHGLSEGDTITKTSFVRHPDNPEYYCYIPTAPGQRHAKGEGTYVGFGDTNGITTSSIWANSAFYEEYVEEMLHRSARWTIDRTKVDGFRLDAVKHTPADFFGATFGIDKDTSDYGYLGQTQRQFNLTRGFSDANHRDTVFNTDAARDDAMVFGEHLGQPPAYGDYIDAGMRLIDNDLRNNLNNILGNPSASLFGYDSPGAGGFSAGVNVMHAQSHDNDFAARRELQHAFYFMREGFPLVYTDFNYHAGVLEGSGGAFPRHANTAFLGQFGDNRLPNLAYLHQHFSRGTQHGRWGDDDFVAFERLDKRENPGMSDADATVALFMMNDNYASGQARNFYTSFPSEGGTSNDAYLYQYARGYGSQVGFYEYASNLGSKLVAPGSYFVFSYRTPEESNAWKDLGGRPIEILQNGSPVSTLSVTRRDGPNGDGGFNGPGANPGFHPYPSDISNWSGTDFTYEVSIPRITDATDLQFVFRTDSSAANILAKLNGGIDLNGTGADPVMRDNPPGATTDMFLGYEQPDFVERMGPEKFAGTNTPADNALSSLEAGFWEWDSASGVTAFPGSVANTFPPDTVFFVYHDPTGALPGDIGAGMQFQEWASTIDIYVKSSVVGDTSHLAEFYYTTDGVTEPQGVGGVPGNPETQVVGMVDLGDSSVGGDGTWWRARISPVPAGTLRYKMGVRRTSKAGQPFDPVMPSGAVEVGAKVDGMTVYQVDGFDGTTVEHFPHNDLQKTPDQVSHVTETGLEEGFHILRARAFLKRDGKASLYNTFQQTFYYDATRPQGEVVFPAESDTVSGQSYGVVVRADSATKEVWYCIDDGTGINDDDQTGAQQGNGLGNWVQASEVGPDPNVVSPYEKEFRFNYINIAPGSVPAQIHVRLVEETSSDSSTWTSSVGPGDDLAGWYTTLTRNVTADGIDRQLFIAFPGTNGDVVGDDYIMKAFFTKGLADGLSESQLLDQFEVKIASQQSGQPDGAVVQDPVLMSISYDEDANHHALAFDFPALYNGNPNFLHWVEVVHEASGITLTANRLVKAAVVNNSYASIVTPPLTNPDSSPYVEVLPDLKYPDPEDREVLIQVETNYGIGHVEVLFDVPIGSVALDWIDTSGSVKFWNFIWSGAEAGVHDFHVDAYFTMGGSLAASSDPWSVEVVYGPAVPVWQDNDVDGLPDFWELATGLDPDDNGSTDFDMGPNGDPDGDGLLNYIEFLVGLDPFLSDAADYPQASITREMDGSNTLSFPVHPYRRYRTFWTEDFSGWNQLGSDYVTGDLETGILEVPDTGPPHTPSLPGSGGERYYKLEVTQP